MSRIMLQQLMLMLQHVSNLNHKTLGKSETRENQWKKIYIFFFRLVDKQS